MLRGISPLISPELLAIMHRMGHGDALVLGDAHFPGEALAKRLLRADGLRIAPLLDAILPLLVIDTYIPDPLLMMAACGGDVLDPAVEAAYRQVIDRHQPGQPGVVRLDKPAFYERSRQAFAVVMTGDTAQYANLVLVKGVTR
jgi:L-fucose mutarotase